MDEEDRILNDEGMILPEGMDDFHIEEEEKY